MSQVNAIEAFKSQTMSSIELVKIINDLREDGQSELRHNDFTAKIRKVLGNEAAKFSAPLKTASGQTAQGYNLPKREASLMVMSESYKVQAAVYDKLAELENAQPKVPTNFIEAMQLATATLIENQALQNTVDQQNEEIAALEPKAQALDRLSGADGSMCLTDAAKNLGVQPRKLNKALSMNKWIFKRYVGSHWVAYEDKRQAGYLEHKPCPVKLSDGTEIITQQVRVTANGLAKLALLVAKWGV